ncbi:MAG: type II toxin-antitoxin system HicA family toxin [Beijerinckiaceae bacterium]
MGGNLYPQLVRLLTDAGCMLVRQGKGSHEIWQTPQGLRIVVPRATVNRRTANGILRQAGLPKAF